MSNEHEDARLRRAFRAASEHEQPPGSGCPDAERIWSARAGELPAGERREVVDHVSRCAHCAEAWRLADEVQRDLVELGSDRRSAPRPLALRLGRWPLLAGAAVVLVAFGTVPWLRRPPTPSGYRDGRPGEIRSLGVDQPLPRERCVLRWSGAPSGSRYDVVVTTEALDLVAEARDLTSPEYLVPSSELEAVAGAGRILWRVEATLPDGSRLASPTFSARIR